MPTERAVTSSSMSVRERVLLNALVAESGCWEWQGYLDRDGYGKLTFDGASMMAHRCSWVAYYGDIPSGLLVCHRCDNRKCVNPNHLFLGDAAANSHDMVAKGRHPRLRGERSSQAKLTEDQVREIRRRAKSGTPQRWLAREYGLHPMAINKIVHRKTWRHIDGE